MTRILNPSVKIPPSGGMSAGRGGFAGALPTPNPSQEEKIAFNSLTRIDFKMSDQATSNNLSKDVYLQTKITNLNVAKERKGLLSQLSTRHIQIHPINGRGFL